MIPKGWIITYKTGGEFDHLFKPILIESPTGHRHLVYNTDYKETILYNLCLELLKEQEHEYKTFNRDSEC